MPNLQNFRGVGAKSVIIPPWFYWLDFEVESGHDIKLKFNFNFNFLLCWCNQFLRCLCLWQYFFIYFVVLGIFLVQRNKPLWLWECWLTEWSGLWYDKKCLLSSIALVLASCQSQIWEQGSNDIFLPQSTNLKILCQK